MRIQNTQARDVYVQQYWGPVYQGIDPKALHRLHELLDKKDLELQQKEEEIKEWIRKYHTLDQRLATEEQESALAHRARTLLHEGQLEEAGALLDQLLKSGEAEVERLASHHFSRGQVYELQFEPQSALPHYARAYQYRPDNPTYALAYADLLQTQKHYREAEPIYTGALQTLRSMAAANSATYLPDVALTLIKLGVLYNNTQRLAEAEASYQEALTIRCQLAAANPAAYLPDMVLTLKNLGLLYVQRG